MMVFSVCCLISVRNWRRIRTWNGGGFRKGLRSYRQSYRIWSKFSLIFVVIYLFHNKRYMVTIERERRLYRMKFLLVCNIAISAQKKGIRFHKTNVSFAMKMQFYVFKSHCTRKSCGPITAELPTESTVRFVVQCDPRTPSSDVPHAPYF